jgi:uncharacterized membrane protein required for colicin V production
VRILFGVFVAGITYGGLSDLLEKVLRGQRECVIRIANEVFAMNFPEWLYTIDILFLVFVIFSTVSGLRRGLSGELAHVLTLIGLLAGFCFFFPQLVQMAAHRWESLSPWIIQTAVAGVLLLAAFLIFCLIRMVFKLLLKSRMGEVTDKITGAGIGLLRGALTGLAILAALSLVPNARLYQTISEKSVVGGWVCSTLKPWLYPRIIELPVFNHWKNESVQPHETDPQRND